MQSYDVQIKLERSAEWHNAGCFTATNFRAALDSGRIACIITEWLDANSIDSCVQFDSRIRPTSYVGKTR